MLIRERMDSFQKLSQNLSNHNMNNEPYISLTNSIPEKGFILDAGAGDGKIASILFDIERPTICLDIVKPEKIELGCQYILGTIENLPFKEGIFHSIYCLSVLQLIKNDHTCFKEFHRILKPNGTLFLTLPTKYSIFHILRNLEIKCSVYQFPEFNVPHYHYYTKQRLFSLSSPFFSILTIKGYLFNFYPRFIIFLMNFMRKYGILTGKKIIFPQHKINPVPNPFLLKRYKLRGFFHKIDIFFCHLFPDFTYHYIVIFKKRVDTR